MSAGLRIPLLNAMAGVEWLWKLWKLSINHHEVVGSIRRERALIGDIEFIAPLPPLTDRPSLPWHKDPLFWAINCTVDNPWTDDRGGLFEQQLMPPRIEHPIGTAITGLKPGFKTCCLEVRPKPGVSVPVQVYRYTRANRGWVHLMRTGPREFGMWFLTEWKRQHRIDQKEVACRDNHLVDRDGRIVTVENELEAFEKCGLKFIEPRMRDVKMDGVKRANAEVMR